MKFIRKLVFSISSIIGLIMGIFWLAASIQNLVDVDWDISGKNIWLLVAFLICVVGLLITIIFLIIVIKFKLHLIAVIFGWLIVLISFIFLFGATISSGMWLSKNNAWTNYHSPTAIVQLSLFGTGSFLLAINFVITCVGIAKR